MGYLLYYVAVTAGLYALGVLVRYPWLLAVGLGVFVLRRWLPDPYLFFKFRARVRRLKAEISQNADNVLARRDLAKIWIEKRRPRRAIKLLEEARRRTPDDAELALLYGKALFLSGRAEDSLAPLVEAATKNERLMYGEPYLVAGRALDALGRYAEAEDAFVRFVGIHSSSVEGQVRLALVRRELKDKPGARSALTEGLTTFSHNPGFRRRAELRWWLRGQLMHLGL